ncbi:lipase [Pasteurella canis]|uniref:autotransporter domain-containing protein n=1 Tax=Pasteurella canis TaxID=753 RepID=UPI001E2E2C61|nr:autotransporter domain-containing protein [Pasteurella canis]GJJ80262.1 lipase [Pasteurella canis]
MKINKLFCALLCSLSTASLAQDIVVFGDSLSDMGQTNWNKKASYLNADGKYHFLYNEYLAQALGGKLTSSTQGGSSYAYSGGVIVGTNNERTNQQPNLALQNQVNTYLNTPVKKEALHILWAGGNDLATVLANAVTKKTPEEKQTYVLGSINQMAQTMAQQWGALQQAGVTQIIAPTIPNVTYTPEFFDKLGEAAGAQIQSKSYGLIKQSDFVANFKGAVEQMLSRATLNTQEFELHRIKTLEKAAEDFYNSRAWYTKLALSAAGYNAKSIAETLINEYKEIVQQAAQATALLNASITSALNQVGGNIVRIDTDGLLKDMIARPAEYGLNNTTTVVCKDSTADPNKAACRPTDQTLASQRLFADSFHPGPTAHKAMSDYILNVLQTPKDMGILTQIVQQQTELALDFIRLESNRNRLMRQTEQTVGTLVAYQKQNQGHSLHIGAKVQFNPQWQLAVVASQQKQDLQNGLVHVDTKNRILSTALRYDADNWWLGSAIQVNNTKLATDRAAYIGNSTHYQSGETEAESLSMGLFAGYEWKVENVEVAFIADIYKTKTDLAAFSERNQGITQMQFESRSEKSLRSGVGIDLRYHATTWQPYVTTRWVKEWDNDKPIVKASLNGSTFATKLAQQDKAWLNIMAGFQFKPINSGLYANLGFSRDLGRKDNLSKTTFQAGIGLEF